VDISDITAADTEVNEIAVGEGISSVFILVLSMFSVDCTCTDVIAMVVDRCVLLFLWMLAWLVVVPSVKPEDGVEK